MQSKRVALLGGSFDPIHLGHLALAEEALAGMELDAVWFLPAFISPHKSRSGAGPEDRLAMVRCAIEGQKRFSLCDVEIERGGTSYTYETLEALHALHPGVEWHWILGLDTFLDFPSWKNHRKIVQLAHLVVAPRPGVENRRVWETLKQLGASQKTGPGEILPAAGEINRFSLEGTGHSVFFLAGPWQDISSTAIRREWATNPLIKKMLPPSVVQYIMNHQLYV